MSTQSTNLPRLPAAIFGLILLSLCRQTCAAPATAPIEDDSKWISRVYDVRDALFEIPDFATGPVEALGIQTTMPAPTTAPASQPTDERNHHDRAVKALIGLIRQSVGPDGWPAKEAITETQGRLTIRTTADNHQVIGEILRGLSQLRSVQITVEMRCVKLSPTAAAKFLDGVDGHHTGPFIDEKQVKELIRAVQGEPATSIVTAPRLTLFSGQAAYLLIETHDAYLSSLEIVRPATGPVQYKPQIGVARGGLCLHVRATATADGKSVILAVNPELAELRGIDLVPAANAPDQKVQRAQVQSMQISTAAVVPDGQTLLLAGPELDQWGWADGRAGPFVPSTRPAASERLLLLIRPRIIVPAENEVPPR